MIRSISRSLRPVACCCLAVIPLVAGACKAKEAEEEAAKPEVTASTVVVGLEPFTRTISAIGTVIARPDHYAALSAPSATRITRVYVAPGQRVGRGAPLVEFEQVGFDAALRSAQSSLLAAERNSERAQRLANEGILPRKDAEQAAAELGKARSEAVTAERAKALSVMRSPIAGVVTKLAAVLGASADAGQVLVEVADPSAFDVLFSLSPSEAGEVKPGARVRVSAGEKAGGEELGEGSVASVGAAVDTTTRSVAVRALIARPRRALRLGESVYGTIAVETAPNAVVVPIAALVPEEDGYKVFVVDAKGTAMAREVKVGGRNEVKAEILEGLRGGETIVSQGAYGVEDSVKVAKPVPVKP